MQIVMETIIYILAIIGIVITLSSFFEMITYKNICSYRLLNKRNDHHKRVEMIVHIRGYNEEEENDLIAKLENGTYDKIENIVDSMKIEKE